MANGVKLRKEIAMSDEARLAELQEAILRQTNREKRIDMQLSAMALWKKIADGRGMATVTPNPVDTLLSQLDVTERSKPTFPITLCQLRLLQVTNVLLQEVLQQLKRIEGMKKPEKPVKGGKIAKKCPTCKKMYAGKECQHCKKAGLGGKVAETPWK